MKKIEFTKADFAKLVKENPIAATEWAWELRKTLDDCNKRRRKLHTTLSELSKSIAPLREGKRDGATFGNVSAADDTAKKILGET